MSNGVRPRSAKKSAQQPERDDDAQSQFSRFAAYVEDSRKELTKVSWPTVQETRKATLVVLGFVAVMALILGLVDLGLSNLTQLILS